MGSMEPTRRGFMKTVAGAAAVQTGLYKSILPASVMGANEKIRTGHIGMGGMGMSNLNFAMQREEIQPVAVCDLFPPHRERAVAKVKEKYETVSSHHDFREIIDNKDIDAVVICTPDHWHAIPAIMACDAGKDVWCEKPLSTTIEEGRHIVNAAKRNNTIFQCGTMQRSGEHFQEAVQLVRDGYIGQVARVATWIHDAESPEGIGNPPDENPPDGCDWDFHQGWTHRVPFNKNRWIYNFRWFLDYSGGKVTDWGAHLIDIANWAMGEEKQPLSVAATGGKYVLQDNRTTPDTIEVVWQFPDYVLSFSNRVYNNVPNGMYPDRPDAGHGIAFYGVAGTLFVSRDGYEVFPMKRGDKLEVEPKKRGNSQMHKPHWQNFAESVKARKQPISTVEGCHATTRLCHMATCSYVAGCKQLLWDGGTERFHGADLDAVAKANAWANRPYENGWVLG